MGVGRLAGLSVPVRHLVAATLCALAAAAVYPLRQLLEPANVVMLLLLVVAFNAAWLGRGPAVLGTVVSVALFDFLFVPPQLSFAVSDVKYLITFAVMLLVSLLIGQLTVSLRASADEAALRERRSHALYALARSLAGAMLPAQVMEQVAAFVRTEAGAEVHFHLPDEDDGALHPQPAGVPAPGVAETTAAAGIFFTPAEGQAGCVAVAGVGLMLPLHGATRCRGVMVVQPGAAAAPLESLRPLLEAVASLAAIALERLHFVAVAQASQFEAEAERLRNSILASISHDIRTRSRCCSAWPMRWRCPKAAWAARSARRRTRSATRPGGCTTWSTSCSTWRGCRPARCACARSGSRSTRSSARRSRCSATRCVRIR